MAELDQPQNSIESDPNHYSVVVDGDKDIIDETRKGHLNWEITIDMQKGNIYIGGDHDNTPKRYNIPITARCDAIANIDLQQNSVTIPSLFDWRGNRARIIKGPIKDAILVAIKRDLLRPTSPEN
ncbi:hypothetical protein HYW59_04340 [Candidatus Kaiserbacteria bacterium]|nr:hypothetical protein [Candidatus Kaiserbacteria bacterium]